MRMSNVAIAFAALVASATAAPLTASLAEPAISSPNTVNNATVDPATKSSDSTGVYDIEDQYLDLMGFPLPGWQYLTRPPS
jgi:hypothetical protein